MKQNRPNALRELSIEELQQKVGDLMEELFNLRFRNSVRQLDNPLKIRDVRRDLARVHTILREREKGIREATGAGLKAR